MTKINTDRDRLIGDRVRAARTLRGLSQEKLGEACGVTFQQIQKYERGTNRVSGSRFIDIALALDVTVEWFFADFVQGSEKPDLVAELVRENRQMKRKLTSLEIMLKTNHENPA
uniref:helix-turn-helix domain-containing protein n=1 Tax=Rhizobium sp. CFBP 8762 TaxID=2775279 RepID=UPI0018D5DDEB|nr:helix-turn-helix transcriptional regulator [Rhizobium sp. CFBP 8762]